MYYYYLLNKYSLYNFIFNNYIKFWCYYHITLKMSGKQPINWSEIRQLSDEQCQALYEQQLEEARAASRQQWEAEQYASQHGI